MKIEDDTFDAAETIGQLLRMLAGAASACWENINAAGVFDSQGALALTNAAEKRLYEILDEENNKSKIVNTEGDTVRVVPNVCDSCKMPRDNRHPKLCPICLLGENQWKH